MHRVTDGHRVEKEKTRLTDLDSSLLAQLASHRDRKRFVTIPLPSRQAPCVPIRLMRMPMQHEESALVQYVAPDDIDLFLEISGRFFEDHIIRIRWLPAVFASRHRQPGSRRALC